jgi:hypothetical protein
VMASLSIIFCGRLWPAFIKKMFCWSNILCFRFVSYCKCPQLHPLRLKWQSLPFFQMVLLGAGLAQRSLHHQWQGQHSRPKSRSQEMAFLLNILGYSEWLSTDIEYRLAVSGTH